MLTLKKNAIRYKDSNGTIKDTGVLCDVSVVGGEFEGVKTGEIILADNTGSLEIETGINAKCFLIKAMPITAVANTGVRAVSIQFWDFENLDKSFVAGTNSTGTTVSSINLPNANDRATIDENGKITLPDRVAVASFGYFVPNVTYKWYAG